MALHCPECGFVNTDGANYCQKCGAFLGDLGQQAESSTATYRIDESTGELVPVELDDMVAREGAALVVRAGGGRVGESFPLDHERMSIGRRPDSEVFLDDVTVSRDHAILVRRGDERLPRRPRLAERHLRQPPAHRLAPSGGRRRGPDREVQAHVPLTVTMATEQQTIALSDPPPDGPRGKPMTIGAVCKALSNEFPDISISKIRYLEDQKLLAPRRTPGGYRLYTQGDVARLRTILRLQRDEFLPLRVIRQELASGRAEGEVATSAPAPDDSPARAAPPPGPRRARVRRRLLARGRRRRDARRPQARAGAAGSRRDRRPAARGHDLVRRHRARDHPRRRRARALRRRRAQPARLPDLGGP